MYTRTSRVKEYLCGGYCIETRTSVTLWDGSHDHDCEYDDYDIGDCTKCVFKCEKNKNKELKI